MDKLDLRKISSPTDAPSNDSKAVLYNKKPEILHRSSRLIEADLFYVLFVTLLIIGPILPMDAGVFELFVIVGITLLIVLIKRFRIILINNIYSLKNLDKTLILLLVVSVAISSILSKDSFISSLFGIISQSIGLMYWLCVITIAIFFMKIFPSLMRGKLFAYITAVSMLVSTVLFGFENHVYRHGGVMFQATSMGILSLVSIIIFYYHYTQDRRFYWIILLLLSVVNLFGTKSRIAVLVLLILGVLYLLTLKSSPTKKIFFVASSSLFLVLVYEVIKDRFNISKIFNDIQYRIDIYRLAIGLSYKRITGIGPTSGLSVFNDKSLLTGQLLISNQKGYYLSSAHNIFLDFWLFFGPVGIATLVLLTIRAGINVTSVFGKFEKMLFFILLSNSFVNVSDIVLTSLLIFTVISYLPKQDVHFKPAR